MVFIKPEIVVPTVVFDNQRKTIKDAPRKFALYADAVIKPLAQGRADTTINVALAPHRRPTDFQTPKQRAWWFAVGVHRWSGRKPKQDWRVVVIVRSADGEFVASNPMPGAPFVFKPGLQQRMHIGTWLDTETYAKRERAGLIRDVRQGWRDVTRAGK